MEAGEQPQQKNQENKSNRGRGEYVKGSNGNEGLEIV